VFRAGIAFAVLAFFLGLVMKKFNKYLLKLSLLLGLNAFGSAYAQFWSLHQSPVVFNISSSLDAGGNLVYQKTSQLFGFKDQFDPTGTGTTAGVTACLIGYPEFRNKCQTVNGGFAFTIDGYSSNQEFKVYVPAGTKFFGVSGYMPQSVQYGVAVKLGSPPARTEFLTEAEYQAAKSGQNRFQDFQRLVNGEERIIVHDGGGAISLSGIARLTTPFSTGQWMYFRVLTANTSIAGLGAIYEVDLNQYRTAYNSLAFGTNGDPLDNGSTPNVPTLTNISLSRSTWNAATDINNTTITVKPTPLDATLPTCTVSPANVLTAGTISATEAVFSILPSAVTEDTTVTINCGGKIADLTLQAIDPNAAQITDKVSSIDENGNLVLNFKLTRPDTELAATNQTNFWVAALVPKTGFPFSEDDWFFLTPNGWTWLTLPHPPSVAYQLNQTPTAETSFSILTGLPKIDFEYFNAELYFGYMGADGVFKNMGAIWKKN
jgi:hypothetical protein